LRKNGQLVFVQCKHWKARSVGVKVVREIYGVMAAKSVKQAIVVINLIHPMVVRIWRAWR
jgi:restriction system protein